MAYISDINPDLILIYTVIQQQADTLCDFLERSQKKYDNTDPRDRNHLFLSIRNQFNAQRFEINYNQRSENWILRAAQLIFLNKICFNGLYRLNSKGEFNIPHGKYSHPKIADPENITAVSTLLQNVEIKHANYTDCLNKVTSNSFVYFDPPYKPLSKTANFTTYTGTELTDREQLALANFYRKLDTEKHAKLMLSNSDPENNFFEMLFEGYNIHKVTAARAINCNAKKRGKIKELVIINYKI